MFDNDSFSIYTFNDWRIHSNRTVFERVINIARTGVFKETFGCKMGIGMGIQTPVHSPLFYRVYCSYATESAHTHELA